MKKLSKKMLALATFVYSLLTPQPIYAQATSDWATRIPACVEGDVATLQGIECLLGNIFSIAISGVGIAAFVMLIVGSFLYLTSGGNPKATDAGQKTITFAVVGILVAISSWIILNFIGIFAGPNVAKLLGTFSIIAPSPSP